MGLLEFNVHADAALATGKKVSAEKVSTWRDDCDWLYQKIEGAATPDGAPVPGAVLIPPHNHEVTNGLLNSREVADLGAPLALVQNFPRGLAASQSFVGPVVQDTVITNKPRLHVGDTLSTTTGSWNYYAASWEVLRIGGVRAPASAYRYLRARVGARRTAGAGSGLLRVQAAVGSQGAAWYATAADSSVAVTGAAFAAVELEADLWSIPAIRAKLFDISVFDLALRIVIDVPTGTTIEVDDTDFGAPAWALCSR